MKFYLDSRNPYRNFIKNVRKIHSLNSLTLMERSSLYVELYKKLSDKFDKRFLVSHPSNKFFQNEDNADKLRNPYLTFQIQFEHALQRFSETEFHGAFCKEVSTELAFLCLTPRREDWLYD